MPSMHAAMRMRTQIGVTPAGDARSLCGQRTLSPGLDEGMTCYLQDLPPRLPREAIQQPHYMYSTLCDGMQVCFVVGFGIRGLLAHFPHEAWYAL